MDKKIEDMVWSYSRLSSYYNCKWAWHRTYIKGIKGEQNFYAQSGSLMHQVLEDYADKKVDLWDLPDHYEKIYCDFVNLPAPPNKYHDMSVKRFTEATEYLNNFEGFEEVGEVISVEKEIKIKIADKYDMIGFIDLLLVKDDEYIVLDHKSRGKISKKEIAEYMKQLYVYSKAVFDEFGKYPSKLILNQFNIRTLTTEIFNIEKYNEAIKWCEDTIELIINEKKWKEYNNTEQFFCDTLCNHRSICKFKKKSWDKGK